MTDEHIDDEVIAPEDEDIEEITDEDLEEEIEEDPEEVPPKKKQTAQERIDEITYKYREQEREAQYWKNLAMGDKEEVPTEPEAPVIDRSGRPVTADFDTVEDYEDALLTWHDEKKEERRQTATQQRQQEESMQNFNKNAESLRKEYDDYDTVIEKPVFTPDMRRALLMTDNGPMVAYHIGKNPEVASKINTLPPERQILEIGKLETQLLMAQKPKKQSSAAAPISPVGATASPDVDPSDMTTDEWMKWNKEQDLAKIEAKLKKQAGG